MGLAGRKTKQRIGADPRNLTWSDDSAKFGAKYLQNLGWTAGTGLGVSGEGRTSNLKIHQKLDLMGIGANRRGGDDAGWRGGREFEGLLARLNQAQNADTLDIPVDDGAATDENGSAIDQTAKGGGSMQQPVEANDDPSEPTVDEKDGKTKRKGDGERKKKRKRSATEDEETDAKEAKRRRKEERKRKKEQRKAEKATKRLQTGQNSEDGSDDQVAPAGTNSEPVQGMAVKVVPRYRAHRARNLASKRLAAASATGMNEILGITSSTAPGQKMETSIAFPPLNIPPPKPGVKSDACQTDTPGGLFPAVGGQLKHAGADDRNTTYLSAMGSGSYSGFGGGLGFRGPTEQAATAIQEHDENNLLRKSGKSIAEYFAKKMRMKSVRKDNPAFTNHTEIHSAGRARTK